MAQPERNTPKKVPKKRREEKAQDWLDCFAACVNSLGWEWAPLCAYLCDQDFPEGAGDFGFPTPHCPERPAAAPDGFLPFKGCRGFYENVSGQPETTTITIYNPGPGNMDIRLQRPDNVLEGGNPITIVEEGEYKTITVTIPANRRLHGNSDGYRKLEKSQ